MTRSGRNHWKRQRHSSALKGAQETTGLSRAAFEAHEFGFVPGGYARSSLHHRLSSLKPDGLKVSRFVNDRFGKAYTSGLNTMISPSRCSCSTCRWLSFINSSMARKVTIISLRLLTSVNSVSNFTRAPLGMISRR